MSRRLVDVTNGTSGVSQRTEGMREFGGVLRKLRAGQALSQTELAEKAQCSRALINLLESGKRSPTQEILEKLVRALDLADEDISALYQAAGKKRGQVASGLESYLATAVASVPEDSYLRHLAHSDLATHADGWRRLAKAFTTMRSGHPEQARLTFDELSEQRDLTPTLRVFALRMLAEACRMQADFDGACEAVERAFDLKETLPRAIVTTGDSEQRQLLDDLGAKSGEGLLSMAHRDARELLRAVIVGERGENALRAGKYREAEEDFRESLGAFQPLDVAQDGESLDVLYLGMGSSHLRLAKVMMYLGESERAIEHCKKANEYLDSEYLDSARNSAQKRDRKRRTSEIQAWAHARLRDFDEARRLHEGARQEAESLGNRIGEMNNWIYLGDDWRRQAEYIIAKFRWSQDQPGKLAIPVPADALRAAEERADDRDKRLLKQAMSEAELAYDTAMDLIQRGHEDPLTLGLCLRGMAVVSRLNGRFAEADERLHRAEKHEREIGLLVRLPSIFETRADVCWDQGLLSLAEYWYEKTEGALDAVTQQSGESVDDYESKSMASQRQRVVAALKAIRKTPPNASIPDPQGPSVSWSGRGEIGGGAATSQRAARPADSATQWKKVSEDLRQRVAEAISASGGSPLCVVDTDPDWLREQLFLETLPGPRLLAQDIPSVSLCAEPPRLVVEADRREGTDQRQKLHIKRHKAFRKNLDARRTHVVEEMMTRDLCSFETVRASTDDDEIWLRLTAARDLQEVPVGQRYQIESGPLGLPLAYCVKGERVLIEIPWEEARNMGLTSSKPLPDGVDKSARHYCYRFDDEQLANALRATFETLFKIAVEYGTASYGAASGSWLRHVLENRPSEPRPSANM